MEWAYGIIVVGEWEILGVCERKLVFFGDHMFPMPCLFCTRYRLGCVSSKFRKNEHLIHSVENKEWFPSILMDVTCKFETRKRATTRNITEIVEISVCVCVVGPWIDWRITKSFIGFSGRCCQCQFFFSMHAAITIKLTVVVHSTNVTTTIFIYLQ